MYFHEDATNYRYDPSTCPECIEENVNNYGISYEKMDERNNQKRTPNREWFYLSRFLIFYFFREISHNS